MPKYDGVCQNRKRRWYFKVWLGRDPLTSQQRQMTKRGRSAAEAARARRELLESVHGGRVPLVDGSLSVNDLLDLNLDGLDQDRRLSATTWFD